MSKTAYHISLKGYVGGRDFVDEITDLADEPAPKLTDAIASAMASAGMPIPNIQISESDKESAFGKFLAALTFSVSRIVRLKVP